MTARSQAEIAEVQTAFRAKRSLSRLDLELGAWIALYAVLPFMVATGVGIVATAFFALWAAAWRRAYHEMPWQFRLVALVGLIGMWIVAFGLLWALVSMLPTGSDGRLD